MHVETIARAAHEVNRAYCSALGDSSQPAWEDAPEWQRQSAFKGVIHAIEHPDAKPSDSHESWLAEKRAAGWKWGPVKDPEKKEHPCFIEYDRLPTEQKTKDFLFLAVVRALTSSTPRVPSNDALLQFFKFSHLPQKMQEVSAPFCELAHHVADTLPSNPERTVALRKLLESKDCAVRATIWKKPE